MTQSAYFRLVTTVFVGMGITDGKLLFGHGISEGSVERRISTRDYNPRTVYDSFNKLFPVDCGSPNYNLPPVTIYDRPRPDKIPLYH